jgi:MFS family permease
VEETMSVLEQPSKLPHVPARSQPISLVAWASLVSACAAWMFDAMDLQIFTLVLFPSVSELVGSTNPPVVAYTGGLIFACKFVAVGLGGIVFGVAADRIGRSTTMIITVLIYSVFTGLSALAQNWWQLALLQALAGVGIGSEWAAGAALIAETWPERIRPRALIIMQLSFAVGVFLAALLNLVIGPFGWRFVFAAGAAPALLTIGIRIFVPEPERWIKVKNDRRLADFLTLPRALFWRCLRRTSAAVPLSVFSSWHL